MSPLADFDGILWHLFFVMLMISLICKRPSIKSLSRQDVNISRFRDSQSAQEDFIRFCCHESFKTYAKVLDVCMLFRDIVTSTGATS
jgi:hypothetical protein